MTLQDIWRHVGDQVGAGAISIPFFLCTRLFELFDKDPLLCSVGGSLSMLLGQGARFSKNPWVMGAGGCSILNRPLGPMVAPYFCQLCAPGDSFRLTVQDGAAQAQACCKEYAEPSLCVYGAPSVRPALCLLSAGCIHSYDTFLPQEAPTGVESSLCKSNCSHRC